MEPDYRSIFEGLPGLYLVLDPRLRIRAASDAYLQATLTTRAGIIGRHLFDVFPDNPDDPSADAIRNTRVSLNRVLQSGRPDAMVVQPHDVRRPDSEGGGFEARYWSPVNSPILGPDGAVACILHRVANVTEFVQLTEHGQEQAKFTDELRERAVRTEADLYARSREVADANRKLKLANEELARLYARSIELDTLKSQFFANVSHELRTPLTLILAPLEQLLQRDDLEPAVRRPLGGVQRSARLLLRRVTDLLDVARLEAGQMQAHYAGIDLAAPVRLTASHFDSRAAERKIGFEVRVPAVLHAEVDAEKVERILLNLLANAFKFTPAGGAIALGLREVDGEAVLEVEDSGPGVPEPLREAIFERFRQGDGSAQRQHGGTGLGLAIVREFAQLHRGSATAGVSRLGGALFRVALPMLAPPGVQAPRDAPGGRPAPHLANDEGSSKADRRAEEAVQESERRKDQFLALLAHELRNPLAPIRNAVQILSMSPAANAAPASQLLPMMERQLAHMTRLLDDLLDVSRIATGRIELRKERIELAAAVQVAVEANQPLLDAMGHRMTVAFPPGPVLLDADPARLTQVVSNLLHNAATYSPPGSRIELTAGREGGEIAICVKDNGIGIAPDEIHLIFDMFVQAGAPFSRPQRGLGVGLSVARTMAELHGGRIEARSAGPGQGSEFIIRWPLHPEPPHHPPGGQATGPGA